MLDWVPGSAPACLDSEHGGEHRIIDLHLHRSQIQLPDGSPITPVSFYPGDPYGRDRVPEYGLYLDPRWRPPWTYQRLDWPDFGVPPDLADAQTVLGALLERARSGQWVEVGCWGGHGRTGTALACLATLAGYPANDAVAWVRSNYCARAVETQAQAEFVLSFAEL